MAFDHRYAASFLPPAFEDDFADREQTAGLFDKHASFADEAARRLWSEAAMPREVVFTHNQSATIDRPPEATHDKLLRRFEGWVELFTADLLADAVADLPPVQRREAVAEYRREVQHALSSRFDAEPEALPLGAKLSLEEAARTSVRAFRAVIAKRPDWLAYVDRAVASAGFKWSEFLASDLSEPFLDDLNHLAGMVNLSPVPVQTALLKRGLVVRDGVCQRREDVPAEEGAPEVRSEAAWMRYEHNVDAYAAGKAVRQSHEGALAQARRLREALNAKQKDLKIFLGKEGDVPNLGSARAELQRTAQRITAIEARLRQIGERHVEDPANGVPLSGDHHKAVESIDALKAEEGTLVEKMQKFHTLTRFLRELEALGYPVPSNWSLGQVVASLETAVQGLTTRPFSRLLPQADHTDYAE